MLLTIIIIFNLLNFTTFSFHIVGLEKFFANRPMLLTSVILVQIIATTFFVWYYSKKLYTKVAFLRDIILIKILLPAYKLM